MRLEIIGDTSEECLPTKMNTQHADHGASLKVADVVKDLIDLEGISNGYFDGVRSSQRVEMECLLNTFSLWYNVNYDLGRKE